MAHYAYSNTPEKMRVWDNKEFIDWIAWAAMEGWLFTVKDEMDELQCLAIARPVDEAPDWTGPPQVNPDGRGVYLDLVVNTGNLETMRVLAQLLLQKFGNRKYLAYSQQGNLVVRDYDRTRKALLKDRT